MTGRWKRRFMLVYGLIETFVFSGNILGWTALNYMLKKHGVYHHLCLEQNTTDAHEENSTYDDNVSDRIDCSRQDKMLSLAFTIGSFCVGISAFLWGFLIDHWCLRNVRLLINALITTGTILLSITNPGTPFLVFPALILMCLAGVPLRIANMQIANLFPKQRSTVISLYCGAFCASAAVFILIKYAFDAGLQWEWVCFILIAASCVMLLATLFLLPSDKISEIGEEEKNLLFRGLSESSISCSMSSGKFSALPPSPYNIRKGSDDSISQENNEWKFNAGKVDHNQTQCKEPQNISTTKEPSLLYTLSSLSYIMHQYWFSWLLLITINYSGSLNLWLERITSDSTNTARYTQIYGLTQFSALVFSPLIGVVMDRSISRAAKENDPDTRKLKTVQSGFLPMLLTTATQAAIQVCKFFDSVYAVYVSVVLVTIVRSLLIAVATSYLRIRFPASQFNPLLGIMSTTSAVFTLLQYPLFIWESPSAKDALHVNIFNSCMLIIPFVHPLLLTLTRLQKYFIRKEKHFA